jgi:hypothetical protein
METSAMEIIRDIIQLIFTPIMLLIIFGYQWYKIKNLKDQLNGNNSLLNSIKIYFDVLNPEMINHRVEMYEKILEKEKKMALDKMESKVATIKDNLNITADMFMKNVNSATGVIAESFVFVPHSQRIKIVEKMEDNLIKSSLKSMLGEYKEIDLAFTKVFARATLGTGMAPTAEKKPISGINPGSGMKPS